MAKIKDEPKVMKIAEVIFNKLDKTGLGAITKKKAKSACTLIMSGLGHPELFNEKAFDFLFNVVDKDKDGALNFDELTALIQKFINKEDS